MKKHSTTSILLAAVAPWCLLVSDMSRAAGVVVAWNSVSKPDDEFSHATYNTPYGFSSAPIDDLSSSPIRGVGIQVARIHSNFSGFDSMRLQNVPSAVSISSYIEFDIVPKAGVEMDPARMFLVLWPNLSGDAGAGYEVRASVDGFSTVVASASWGDNIGGYRKLEADLSSMAAFSSPTTFRVYLSDSRDSTIRPVSSNAIWPYGLQVVGETASVPEPSVLVIAGLGFLGLAARRHRRS